MILSILIKRSFSIQFSQSWISNVSCTLLKPHYFSSLNSSSSSIESQKNHRTMSSTTSESEKHAAVFVTAPDETIAKKIAHGLVEQKLAACVNIIPQITSIYSWQGKINEDSEQLLMIKTRASRVDDISKFVREHHPYSLPEVISVNIENGNPPYLDWISESVPKKET